MIKKYLILCFAAALCSPAADLRAQEDLGKLYSDSSAQWLDGRPEDAAGALKYVAYRATDTALTLAAMKDLAVLFAEAGKNSEALAHLAKAEILAPEDFYVQFEKGWNLLCLEKDQDARAAFEKSLTLTADPSLVIQTRFALALTEARLSGPAAAVDQLRSVYTRYPYLLSPSAQMMAFYLEKMKKKPHALNFMKEALSYDPRNLQAEIDLARLYEETGFNMPAWQTYYTLYDLDPEEPAFSEKIKKLSKYVKGKAEDLLYWARMAWPAHKNPIGAVSGPSIKIALYAGRGGAPAAVKSFSFIVTSDFDMMDARLGRIFTGRSGVQWTFAYNEMNRLYELRDNSGAVTHTTANNVRIVPKSATAVILIKSPELPEAHGVNRSDKEVAGEVLILTREKGFWLINETAAEYLVSPVTASLSDRNKLPEYMKALAVTVRTRLAWLAASVRHESREYQLCDSAHCLVYPGLQAENDASAEAAKATRGEVLQLAGATAPAEFHRACGGITREGVNDSGRPAVKTTPFGIYSRRVEAPPDGLFCMPEDKTESADVSWTLMLAPKWIESRLNRKYKVGYLKALVPLAREADGRIRSMRAEGTAGTAVIEGPAAIAEMLTAGTLRSTLFSIRPIYRGKFPEFFMLRGTGTGDGTGLCLMGGRGMAKNLGAKYLAILSRYYPYYKVKKVR
ncbi:MAG TPA: hypothetical protein DCZ92_03800 [Elusimicrobia bacterium]|nr:MAG: hypothetical protein A2016_01305 [Elusimicrobia bacterium GWF2_62_30]HBA59942.1 hypothetical protein [Elusimicrobiota bacterium]